MMPTKRPPAATFLAKTEPEAYSYDDLVREGKTAWNGVRNAEARKNLRAMRLGDQVLIYHTGKSPAIVGIAKVTREAYPEPSAETWSVVDLRPVRRLARPVTLAELRSIPDLAPWALLRRSRLSVVPVSSEELAWVTRLERANTRLRSPARADSGSAASRSRRPPRRR